jgi:hypothetical protein
VGDDVLGGDVVLPVAAGEADAQAVVSRRRLPIRAIPTVALARQKVLLIIG